MDREMNRLKDRQIDGLLHHKVALRSQTWPELAKNTHSQSHPQLNWRKKTRKNISKTARSARSGDPKAVTWAANHSDLIKWPCVKVLGL